MKLSPLTVPYNAVTGSLKLLFIFLFFSVDVFADAVQAPLIAGSVFMTVVILSGLYSYLKWKRFDYFFTDDSLKITKGVIKRSDRDIPLSRIQNVDVKRNLVHRILGVAVVKLETAGGDTTEASLKFVEFQESGDIKRKIREFDREKKEKEQEQDERELLYSMDNKELVLLGLTGIDQRVFIGVLVLIVFSTPSFAPVLEQAGIGVLTGLSLVSIIAFAVVLASNFVTNIMLFYDFRLWRERNTLEYERGLLNRSEGSIPLRKLQRLVVSDNPLKRVFDRASLSIETAGYSRKDQGMELAIPLDKTREIESLISDIEPVNSSQLEKIPLRSMRRYFTRYALISTALIIGAQIFLDFFTYLSLPIAVTFSVLASYMKWVHTGYSASENHFTARRGFWQRRKVVVPYYRTQNIIVSDTVFQRLWDLSSLTVDVAGTGFLTGDAKITDIDRKEARRLSQQIHERFQKSLGENRSR